MAQPRGGRHADGHHDGCSVYHEQVIYEAAEDFSEVVVNKLWDLVKGAVMCWVYVVTLGV